MILLIHQFMWYLMCRDFLIESSVKSSFCPCKYNINACTWHIHNMLWLSKIQTSYDKCCCISMFSNCISSRKIKVYSEKYYKIILCIWDASDLTYAIVYHIIFSCILYIIFFFVPCIANFLGNKNGNIWYTIVWLDWCICTF